MLLLFICLFVLFYFVLRSQSLMLASFLRKADSTIIYSVCSILVHFQLHPYKLPSLFRKKKLRKAAGPDCISAATLRDWADLFIQLLAQCTVSTYNIKTSIIKPVPKRQRVSCLKDYRLVALPSIVMKWRETTTDVLDHLKLYIGLTVV